MAIACPRARNRPAQVLWLGPAFGLCSHTLRIHHALEERSCEGDDPFAIGNIMCRETLKKESLIEEIVREASDSLLPGTSESTFLEIVSQIMEARLDEIAKVGSVTQAQ
ncbi:Phosphatidylinositol 4-kinase gamma 2-like protein [Drosera capensis]